METYSIFDIVGPTMVGPSSSHTAGAVRVGYICQKLFGRPIKHVDFLLHGSFATTYKGHGTDIALVAGILGMNPSNPQIPQAFDLATAQAITWKFSTGDIGDVHPNSVKVTITGVDGSTHYYIGASLGGGKAKIIAIDDLEVNINGDLTTLIAKHSDRPGFVADVSRILANNNINIASMKLFREEKGANAVLVIETDVDIDADSLEALGQVKHLLRLTFIKAIQ